jgi:hypothetical protein
MLCVSFNPLFGGGGGGGRGDLQLIMTDFERAVHKILKIQYQLHNFVYSSSLEIYILSKKGTRIHFHKISVHLQFITP